MTDHAQATARACDPLTEAPEPTDPDGDGALGWVAYVALCIAFAELRERLSQRAAENARLHAKVARLEAENARLKAELASLRPPVCERCLGSGRDLQSLNPIAPCPRGCGHPEAS